MMKKLLLLPAFLVLFAAGCYYDSTEELNPGMGLFDNCDTTSNVSYSRHIVPLLQNYCYPCHSGSSPSSGIHLDSYADVYTQASTGVLEGSVYHQVGYVPMPPSFQLDSCRMNQIHLWVAAGSPNN